MIAQAVITKASTDLPIVIVVDNDEPGRDAKSTLSGRTFGFDKKQILTYSAVFDDDKALLDKWRSFPVEAEDLFDPGLLDAFVEANGESILQGKKKRPDGAWHYDMGESAKELLDLWVTSEATPHQVTRWVEMLLRIRTNVGLEIPTESASELVESAGDAPRAGGRPVASGQVLVIVGQHDHARYLSDGAIALTGAVDSGVEFTHVGFYSRAILPHVPLVLADHPNLQLSGTTSATTSGNGQGGGPPAGGVRRSAHLGEQGPRGLDGPRPAALQPGVGGHRGPSRPDQEHEAVERQAGGVDDRTTDRPTRRPRVRCRHHGRSGPQNREPGDDNMKIGYILDSVDNGTIVLPEFQRGYVWSRDQVKGLMQSLYQRFPVGGLLIWNTQADTTDLRGADVPGSTTVKLLLDGQQRVTSLYGVMRGAPPRFFEDPERTKSFTGLHFHLERETFEFYRPSAMADDRRWISVTDLMLSGPEQFTEGFGEIEGMTQPQLIDYVQPCPEVARNPRHRPPRREPQRGRHDRRRRRRHLQPGEQRRHEALQG